ncbi:MAG: GNAT family N-acetyltransferase [Bauldia sp.]|nr:GNAT family N-acetyltransferase [Bauldia sp.]
MSLRSFRRHLAGANILRVAEVGGVVAGYALVLLRSDSRRCRLYSLAVGPAHQGAGIGALLLRDAERRARAAGGHRLGLEVREDNAAAITLYRTHGFAEAGSVAAYYDDGAAALRFEKALAGVPARTATGGRGRH